MYDNSDRDHPQPNRRDYEPRRFKSLIAQLHREAQQRRAHTDDHAPYEAPLVRVTRWLVVATIALATAGFLGFGAAILQWRTLSGQLTEMQNASIDMKNSIAATNKLGNETHRLADEAKRSTDNAIETTEYELRAYVGIVGGVTLKCPLCDTADIEKPIEITPEHLADNMLTFHIENGGRTPAYEASIEERYWAGTFGHSLPREFSYPIFLTQLPFPAPSTGTLNPRDRAPTGSGIDGSVIPLIVRARRHDDTRGEERRPLREANG
jgi:hypothetical protein